MAVTSTVESSNLQFKVDNGKDDKGNTLSKNYSFTGVNPQATPEVVFKAGNSLGALTGKVVQAVYSVQKNLLKNA